MVNITRIYPAFSGGRYFFKKTSDEVSPSAIAQHLFFPNTAVELDALPNSRAYFLLSKADLSQLLICPWQDSCAIEVFQLGGMRDWLRTTYPGPDSLHFFLEASHATDFEPPVVLSQERGWQFICEWLTDASLCVNCFGHQADSRSRKIIHKTTSLDIFEKWRKAFFPVTVFVGGTHVGEIGSPLAVETECRKLRESDSRANREFRFEDVHGAAVRLTTHGSRCELWFQIQPDKRDWKVCEPGDDAVTTVTDRCGSLPAEFAWELCEEWLINGTIPIAV